jgi:hypothetical protein
MKKFLVFLMSIMLMIGVSSCNSCTKGQAEPVDQTDTTVVVAVPTVEEIISLDKQAMFLNHAENYRWFETGVQLKNFLDEENDGAFDLVVNVFQVVEKYDSTSFDTFVYKYQHVGEDVFEEAVHGFWVEDYPLNEEAIKVTFAEAFQKVQEVNLPKPHTRQVVLRKQVGPVEANPQWIFGNLHSQIYVDAVTGAVSKDNPAFAGLNLGTPLGEWP